MSKASSLSKSLGYLWGAIIADAVVAIVFLLVAWDRGSLLWVCISLVWVLIGVMNGYALKGLYDQKKRQKVKDGDYFDKAL